MQYSKSSFSSISEAISSYSKTQPAALCCADQKQCYTYAQAENAINWFAGILSENGVGHGSTVLVESSQTAAYIIAEQAIQSLGAIFVPVEAKATAERIADIINETEPQVCCGISESFTALPFVSYAQINPDVPSSLSQRSPINPDDLAEILYTTGTTGKAKGIEITHRNNIAIAENIAYSVEIQNGNVELIPILMSHSHALRTTYANFLMGGAVVIADGVMFMRSLFELFDKYAITAIDIVPSALRIMLKLGAKKLQSVAGQIRYVELGSAPLTELDKKQLRECLPESRMYNFYGSTESGRTVAYEFSNPEDAPGCIGIPACNATVCFMTADGQLTEASDPDHTGYLAFIGPMNMQGYRHAPDLTAQVLKNGIILTKDIGYRDALGRVYMLGRDDDVINSGGVKISPDDVEAACLRCPDVEDCGCVGIDDPMQGQAALLFVKLQAGSSCTESDIMKFMKDNLDQDKLPKQVRIIEAIPRTSNGKLLRRELRKLV